MIIVMIKINIGNYFFFRTACQIIISRSVFQDLGGGKVEVSTRAQRKVGDIIVWRYTNQERYGSN